MAFHKDFHGLLRHNYRSGLKITFSQPGSARTVPLRLDPHLIQAHAWCMFVAWGVVLPMGVIGARYFRVRICYLITYFDLTSSLKTRGAVASAYGVCMTLCYIQAHAWCMFVAWEVALPMAVIGARYFRVRISYLQADLSWTSSMLAFRMLKSRAFRVCMCS